MLSKFAPRSTPPGTSTQLGRRHGQPQVVFVRNGSVKTSSTKLAYIEYIEYNITLIQCFRASSILLTRVVSASYVHMGFCLCNAQQLLGGRAILRPFSASKFLDHCGKDDITHAFPELRLYCLETEEDLDISKSAA